MVKNGDRSSEGLNQIFEIINAKGDTGELKEIVERSEKMKDEGETEKDEQNR